MFFLLYRQTTTYKHKQPYKAGNDIIDIFTSEDMENTPLRSRVQFHMDFKSGIFSSKTPVSIYNKTVDPKEGTHFVKHLSGTP